jgi:hypothetical protein
VNCGEQHLPASWLSFEEQDMQPSYPSEQICDLENELGRIYAELDRHNADQRDCIRRLAYAYGVAFIRDHAEQAKAAHAQDVLARPASGRGRTLCAVLLSLMKRESARSAIGSSRSLVGSACR